MVVVSSCLQTTQSHRGLQLLKDEDDELEAIEVALEAAV